MNNVIVISALIFMSSVMPAVASAATVRGTGRNYTGAVYATVKDACSAAAVAAQKSLSQKCGLINGTVAGEVKIVLDPSATEFEGSCIAFAEADCR